MVKINKNSMMDVSEDEQKAVFKTLLDAVWQIGVEAIDEGESHESPMALLLYVAGYLQEGFDQGHTLCVSDSEKISKEISAQI